MSWQRKKQKREGFFPSYDAMVLGMTEKCKRSTGDRATLRRGGGTDRLPLKVKNIFRGIDGGVSAVCKYDHGITFPAQTLTRRPPHSTVPVLLAIVVVGTPSSVISGVESLKIPSFYEVFCRKL
ncbi:hypothetical protein OPV22_031180 [Ensete ventricosum]|uniref:Uncharacterized protein n=1 Tax=Ensete ventricosum TaxID=4639 RepID=A0AAV8PNH0_ENSVE|nr:hypothetical protein OPV22_031180 [Ensete ventricosum]